jgi:hypothetical protein
MDKRGACVNCPFRASSPLWFDADGLEALDEGREPGCHVIVGNNLQFNNPLTTADEVCIGYLRWVANRPGYNRPRSESQLINGNGGHHECS